MGKATINIESAISKLSKCRNVIEFSDDLSKIMRQVSADKEITVSFQGIGITVKKGVKASQIREWIKIKQKRLKSRQSKSRRKMII